jgi:predicted molibdopterin-dependent oxidoreductase YjgC
MSHIKSISHEHPPTDSEETLVIDIDGQPCTVGVNWSVAAALVAHGHIVCHRNAAGQARGPFCLSGVCFECLVRIDGIPGRQACLTPVAPGMKVALDDLPEGLP